MIDKQKFNIARKWRPVSFDDVIGQSLAIKVLRNGIYLDHFLPVYLFSGNRGCGKTSTARIFAAAVNCHNLSEFRKNPKTSKLPCLECASCVAIAQGRHPDFIEIDAASHTGVENIRQIIETSSFLPVLSDKKIYLIDEAHMLSRAAFNAFLKLLEEPPASVIFILATTEPEKILDTVKSRSFQVFFNFVDKKVLVNSLKNICAAENINFEEDALEVIAGESEGSVRDAQNLLERVRFASDKITADLVYEVLGLPSNEVLINLFLILVKKCSVKELILFLQKINFYNLSSKHIYEKLIFLARDVIYFKNGVTPQTVFDFVKLENVEQSEVCDLIHFFASQEDMLQKVSNKAVYLEILFMDYLSKKKVLINEFEAAISAKSHEKKTASAVNGIKIIEEAKIEKNVNGSCNWNDFIDSVKSVEDDLLSSMFSQSVYLGFEEVSGVNRVKVSFDKKFAFLSDMFFQNRKVWMPILKNVFGEHADLVATFDAMGILKEIVRPEVKSVEYESEKPVRQNTSKPAFVKKRTENEFDVSDGEKWKFANELLAEFPGKLYLIDRGSNE